MTGIPPLLLLPPGDGADPDPWLDRVLALPDAGVILRDPLWDAETLRRAARRAASALPFVALHARNPHATALAAELGLPVHGPGGQGASCHDEVEVEQALGGGARWVLLSPVWRPTSKPADLRPPLGPARFLAAARGRPVWALGGVTPARHLELLAGGAAGSAVLGGIDAFLDYFQPRSLSSSRR